VRGDTAPERRGRPRRSGDESPVVALGRDPRGPNFVEKEVYDGPPLDDGITGRELDRHARAQLQGLPEKLANRVARHLVAAARTIDSEPDLSYQHTLAARARAARVPVVREATGEAAYASGRYREALQEFKAARRLNGDPSYLAMMADCERALGRPGRAITMSKDDAVRRLDDAGRAEMMIVAAGARRDLGQLDAAIRSLEGPLLTSRARQPWVARVRYAYADLLVAAGRFAEAREWFERTVGVDHDRVTDAHERLAELDTGQS
jgi:tetratricopeptide (TPR) repeat protein